MPAALNTVPAPKQLNGSERVAALLLTMGKPAASKLLKHFDPVELRQITRSAAELGSVPAGDLDDLIEDFASQFASGVDLRGTASDVEDLLTGVLPPEQIADIMSDVMGASNTSMWERFSNIPETTLAVNLAKEHPQTAAVFLSKVTPACAAKVLGQLNRDLRNELMRRMVSLKPVIDSAMRVIETTLHEDLLVAMARNTGPDINSRMADIINKMEREQMEDALQSLSATKPKLAETLKGLLFSFDDLVKLSAETLTAVFDQVSTEKIVLALKGTDAAFRDKILSALTARARRMVESELNSGGPALQRDVMKARRAIADQVLQLAEAGTIEIHASDEGGMTFN